MSTIFIIRGLPNSGKTTLANSLFVDGAPVKAIAADDYPDLYCDGKYDSSKQKLSHEWCKSQVEKVMKESLPVAVHNTFVEIRFCEPYFELAKKYNYKVHVVRSEQLRRYDGGIFDNGHNVPQTTIESMQDRWQPLVEGTKFPPLSEISEQVKACRFLIENALKLKVIVDRDRTLTVTKSEGPFPRNPHDLKLTKLAYLLKTKLSIPEIHVATNQRGLSTGRKSFEDMNLEMIYLGKLLQGVGLKLGTSTIATTYSSKKGYLYVPGAGMQEINSDSRWDKPGHGMLEYFYDDDCFIFIGDSLEDWKAYKSFRNAYPRAACGYCPVELFQLI